MAARAKQDLSKPPQVIVNCMTPGACRSEFNRETRGVGRMFVALLQFIFARTTEAGGRTLVAGLEAGDESNGEYMADCVVAE